METTWLVHRTTRSWWLRQLPNMLSGSRALLGICVPLIWFYGGVSYLIAAVLFAIVSDWADGYLARLLRSETALGRVVDPLADKIFTIFFLYLIAFDYNSVWLAFLAVVTLFYDGDNTFRRRHEIARAFRGLDNQTDVGSNLPVTWLSKSKTAVLFAVILLALLAHDAYFPPLEQWVDPASVVALALVTWSWCNNRKQWLIARLSVLWWR